VSVARTKGVQARRVLVDGQAHVLLTVPRREDPAIGRLSEAERAIARALVTGASNALVSAARQTSLRTVANQVRAVFQKLAVGSRAELIAQFGDVDWGPSPSVRNDEAAARR
jgi:DNA-binding NarL/FixJ family response regulator